MASARVCGGKEPTLSAQVCSCHDVTQHPLYKTCLVESVSASIRVYSCRDYCDNVTMYRNLHVVEACKSYSPVPLHIAMCGSFLVSLEEEEEKYDCCTSDVALWSGFVSKLGPDHQPS